MDRKTGQVGVSVGVAVKLVVGVNSAAGHVCRGVTESASAKPDGLPFGAHPSVRLSKSNKLIPSQIHLHFSVFKVRCVSISIYGVERDSAVEAL